MTDYKAIKYNVSGADLTGLTAGQIPNLAASKITSGELANARVADLPTSKVTSGTFADARISSGSVTQHVTATDLQPIKADITALALREATNEASAAFNLPNQFIETFTDDTNLGTQTTCDRTSGYMEAIANTAGSTITYSYTGSDQTYTVASGVTSYVAVMWGAGGGAGYAYSAGGGGGLATGTTAGAGGYTTGTVATSGGTVYKIVVGQGGFGQDIIGATSNPYGGGGSGFVTSHYGCGGAGGGYSGIFATSVAHGNSVLIAGGGAGSQTIASPIAGAYSGAGGGATGQAGGLNDAASHNANGYGRGGTQSAGGVAGSGNVETAAAGSALQGGTGAHMCGGGGGGYYGGGGAGHTGSNGCSGAGGGSGYIGHANVSGGITTASTNTDLAGTKTPPQTGHTHYSAGIGQGNNGAIGGNGEIVIIPYTLGTNATGTLIQSANAVATNKTKVGGTMLYKDNEGTATLGTDLIIYFTCDGGSNWTEAASYNAITPVYSTGIKQVRLGETTCTEGADVRYKAVWANQLSGSKETQLHGIGMNY